MAQLPKGDLVRRHDKPIHRSCAIYFPGGIYGTAPPNHPTPTVQPRWKISGSGLRKARGWSSWCRVGGLVVGWWGSCCWMLERNIRVKNVKILKCYRITLPFKIHMYICRHMPCVFILVNVCWIVHDLVLSWMFLMNSTVFPITSTLASSVFFLLEELKFHCSTRLDFSDWCGLSPNDIKSLLLVCVFVLLLLLLLLFVVALTLSSWTKGSLNMI